MDVTRSEVVPAWRRLLSDGAAVTGATIVLDIRRAGDGLVVDWADSTLKVLGSVGQRYLSVPQVSATDHPGLYQVNVDLGTVVGVASSGDVLVVTYYEVTAGPTYTPIDDERWRVAAGEPLPTPEVIEVGQDENAFIVFHYARNGVPVTGATLAFTTDRFNNSVHERYDWDTDTFMAPAAVTAPMVTMTPLNVTYAPGVYWWEWAWNNPSNNIFPAILYITIYDGAKVVGRYEIRTRVVDTTNAITTALTAIKGAGFDPATDSLEALRDRGDAAWVTGGGWAVPGDAMALVNDAITAAKIANGAIGVTEAPLLAHLDVDVSSRLATTGYTAPPAADTIGAAVWATAHGTPSVNTFGWLVWRHAQWGTEIADKAIVGQKLVLRSLDLATTYAEVTLRDKDGGVIAPAAGEPARFDP